MTDTPSNAELEQRIDEIRRMLEEWMSRTAIEDLSADEIRAYLKVRDMFGHPPPPVETVQMCLRCIIVVCDVANPLGEISNRLSNIEDQIAALGGGG